MISRLLCGAGLFVNDPCFKPYGPLFQNTFGDPQLPLTKCWRLQTGSAEVCGAIRDPSIGNTLQGFVET